MECMWLWSVGRFGKRWDKLVLVFSSVNIFASRNFGFQESMDKSLLPVTAVWTTVERIQIHLVELEGLSDLKVSEKMPKCPKMTPRKTRNVQSATIYFLSAFDGTVCHERMHAMKVQDSVDMTDEWDLRKNYILLRSTDLTMYPENPRIHIMHGNLGAELVWSEQQKPIDQ